MHIVFAHQQHEYKNQYFILFILVKNTFEYKLFLLNKTQN